VNSTNLLQINCVWASTIPTPEPAMDGKKLGRGCSLIRCSCTRLPGCRCGKDGRTQRYRRAHSRDLQHLYSHVNVHKQGAWMVRGSGRHEEQDDHDNRHHDIMIDRCHLHQATAERQRYIPETTSANPRIAPGSCSPPFGHVTGVRRWVVGRAATTLLRSLQVCVASQASGTFLEADPTFLTDFNRSLYCCTRPPTAPAFESIIADL